MRNELAGHLGVHRSQRLKDMKDAPVANGPGRKRERECDRENCTSDKGARYFGVRGQREATTAVWMFDKLQFVVF